MKNFFRSATKINLLKSGRNIIVNSSNPALLNNIAKALQRIGYVCNTDNNAKTITVANTERFLPASFFMTEVKEALLKSGFRLRRGAHIMADWKGANVESEPTTAGSYHNYERSCYQAAMAAATA